MTQMFKYLKKTILHVKQSNILEKFKQLGNNANLKLIIYAHAAHETLIKALVKKNI